MAIRRLRLPLRLLAIQRTLLKYGLDEIVWRAHLFRPIAWMQKLLPGAKMKTRPLGERLRLALEELGPIYVKFGQAVSTRRDLLSPPLAQELAKLQDQVPPFPSDVAVAALERAFHRPVSEVFAQFEREPLAAASIAQVHAAKLADGAEVVVKILRPDVRALIERDIEVLYQLALLAERYWPDARRLRPVDVVEEFHKTLLHEVDLLREAANAAQLKRNFAGSQKLYVPQVHWDYCRSNVLTTERIRGVPISAVDELRRRGGNIRLLAENGVEIFFTQVFRHNFFHADMHPGNIFVDLDDPEKPRYIAVDFGIVGSLSDQDQHYLAENFLAFFRRDYRRVAALHVDSGWVPPETRVDELESAVRAVCEPIFDRPLKDISFGIVLLRLFETAREFHMEVQPQLVLLQKTLLQIEGLGRELYPELDLWRTAKPILEEWMRERRDPRMQLRRLLESWPEIGDDLMMLPELLHRTIRQAAATPQREPVRAARRHRSAAEDGGGEHGERRSRKRTDRTLAAGAILIAGVLWAGLGAAPIWAGWVGAAVGLAMLLRAAVR